MDYTKKKKQELIEMCQQRGLDPVGKLGDLAKRLADFDNGSERQLQFDTPVVDIINSNDRFYFVLNNKNLSNYFNFGYFYPLALDESSTYIRENRASDLQSEYPYHLVLQKSGTFALSEDLVAIEIITSEMDITELPELGYAYSKAPIPISRVASVHFPSKKSMERVLSSMEAFPDSVPPTTLSKISEFTIKNEFSNPKLNLPYNKEIDAWRSKLNFFDRLLGMFAFLKNAGLFSYSADNKLAEYSDGFFSALYKLNKVDDLSSFKENPLLTVLIESSSIEVRSIYRWIFQETLRRILKNEEFNFKVALTILRDSIITFKNATEGDVEDVKAIIKKFEEAEGLHISHKQLLSDDLVRRKHPSLLALALLAKYSNKSRQHTDKQAVRNLFISNEFRFKQSEMEFLLAILGFYYGYKMMVKADTNYKSPIPTLNPILSNLQSIKFSPNTFFERFLIETVFQYSNSLKPVSNKFDYLKNKSELKTIYSLGFTDNNLEFVNTSFEIFGKVFLQIAVINKIGKIIDSIAISYPDLIDKESHLIHELLTCVPWNKKLVLELLRQYSKHFSADKLNKIVAIDISKTK